MHPKPSFNVVRGTALAAMLVLAAPLQALAQQATITGRVTDASTGDAIAGATVQLIGMTGGAFTDANGEYSLEVRPGTYTLRASMLGYAASEEPVTVAPG